MELYCIIKIDIQIRSIDNLLNKMLNKKLQFNEKRILFYLDIKKLEI